MIKTISVIGATGLLGKPVTLALVNAGFSVKALVRNIERAKAQLPTEIHFIEGDIKNPADLEKVFTAAMLFILTFN